MRALDPVAEDTCRSFRIGAAARLRALVVPGATPQIMTGLRQALAIGVILMVISEMFAASNGIGFTVVQFQRTFAIPQMWTGIILLGLLGVLLSALLRLLEARVLGWHRGIRHAQRDRSAPSRNLSPPSAPAGGFPACHAHPKRRVELAFRWPRPS